MAARAGRRHRRDQGTFFGRATWRIDVAARGFGCSTVVRSKGLALKSPEFEVLEAGRARPRPIVPIYRLTEKVTQRMLRSWIAEALDRVRTMETLPPAGAAAEGLAPLGACMRQIHFPESSEAAESARARLIFESLLAIQIGVLRKRLHRRGEEGIAHHMNGRLLKALDRQLPFKLTEAQERCIAEILRDMAEPRPMTRLVQGDVGSGKTIVAAHAVAAALDSGCQAAYMAPTELLAEQQFKTLRALFDPLGFG